MDERAVFGPPFFVAYYAFVPSIKRVKVVGSKVI